VALTKEREEQGIPPTFRFPMFPISRSSCFLQPNEAYKTPCYEEEYEDQSQEGQNIHEDLRNGKWQIRDDLDKKEGQNQGGGVQPGRSLVLEKTPFTLDIHPEDIKYTDDK
jgi:hypothetical protein